MTFSWHEHEHPKGRSQGGPKCRQLEVGARRAPTLFVSYIFHRHHHQQNISVFLVLKCSFFVSENLEFIRFWYQLKLCRCRHMKNMMHDSVEPQVKSESMQ